MRRVFIVSVATSLVAIVAGTCIQMYRIAVASARESQCRSNLAQVGYALRIYADVHGTFPPTVVRDDSGRAMHSWRALVAPCLGDPVFGGRYKLDEPWDSPANLAAATDGASSRVRQIFCCPSSEGCAGAAMTSYVAVPQHSADWRSIDPKLGAEDLSSGDHGSNALIIELPGSGILWTEPRDVDSAQLRQLLSDPNGPVSRIHSGAIHLYCVDGRVRKVAVGDIHRLTEMVFGREDGVRQKIHAE